ncbi:MAG: citrate/2-methylcitrate synthase, partial [Flavobacteriales bacterium]
MNRLKEEFASIIDEAIKDRRDLLAKYGDESLGEIKVSQLYGGMRGMLSMICETSKLDVNEGIRFRGYSIPELQEKLPKYIDGNEPLPEGIFYLMLTGKLPTEDDVRRVSNQWMRRSTVPPHVFKVIDALPEHTHPMTQFSAAITALRTESEFTKAYRDGINKKDYWIPTYEDS